MQHQEHLKKFLEKHLGHPDKIIEGMICGELSKAMESLKAGKIAPAINPAMMQASPGEFKKMYMNQYYGTFQHELAEAVNKIHDLAEAVGYQLDQYEAAQKKFEPMHKAEMHNPKY